MGWNAEEISQYFYNRDIRLAFLRRCLDADFQGVSEQAGDFGLGGAGDNFNCKAGGQGVVRHGSLQDLQAG